MAKHSTSPSGVTERAAQVLARPHLLRPAHAPIVDLRAGECVGFEAVVRATEVDAWSADAPDARAALEAAGLEACLRGRMTLPGNRFLAVAVSVPSLSSPSVQAVLAGEDDLSRLVLTPAGRAGALPASIADVLDGLRRRGLLLSVVVNEAGRSDLAALPALRPDVVTLHGVLVRDVSADPVRRRVVAAAVDVAAGAGSAVLAREIESVPDAQCLRDLGVQLGQGWLFGRGGPDFELPASDVAGWLRAGATPPAAAPTALPPPPRRH